MYVDITFQKFIFDLYVDIPFQKCMYVYMTFLICM